MFRMYETSSNAQGYETYTASLFIAKITSVAR